MSSKLNILISGDPRDGFNYHGPFHTSDMDAAIKTYMDDCGSGDWWVVPVEPINWGQRADHRTKLWEDAIIAMAALMASENQRADDDRLPWESWNQLFNIDYSLNDMFTGYQHLISNPTCSQCGQATHGK